MLSNDKVQNKTCWIWNFHVLILEIRFRIPNPITLLRKFRQDCLPLISWLSARKYNWKLLISKRHMYYDEIRYNIHHKHIIVCFHFSSSKLVKHVSSSYCSNDKKYISSTWGCIIIHLRIIYVEKTEGTHR